MTALLDRVTLVLFVVAIFGASAFDGCEAKLDAQDRRVPARLAAGGHAAPRSWSAADVLTRALVAEADGHSADYAPILAVFQSRADRIGSTPARLALRYCSIFRVSRPSPRMAEILAMPGVTPPNRRRMWDAAKRAVDAWLGGDHAHGCDATPSHFGDRGRDAARARRMRWREVTCAGALSGFWVER